MGNSKGRARDENEKETTLSQDERNHLLQLFKTVCRERSGLCSKADLTNFWHDHVVKELLTIFEAYLFKDNPDKPINFDTFVSLFIKLSKNPIHKKTEFMVSLLKESENDIPLSYNKIVEYVKDVVASYVIILLRSDHIVLKSWVSRGCKTSESNQMLYAEALCQDLKEKENIEENVERWFTLCSHFNKLQTAFMYYLYHVPQEQVTYGSETAEGCLFPLCKEIAGREFPSLLKLTDVLFLNTLLPSANQLQWRFCFSTKIHGESFSKMLGLISNKGPTLIIIQDKSGYVFGGFASENWTVAPNFHGDENSFLFSLHPKMMCCEATEYNNHYQYLNIHQQTLPNGLGMGGQFEYCGIWIDAEFGKGHCSETCTTYRNYKMLSAKKYFQIAHLEVWAVGEDIVQRDSEDGHTSVRTKEIEAKALLQLSGKNMYSEGFDELTAEEEIQKH